MARSIYLEDIPLEEAQRRFWEALDAAGAGALDRAEEVAVGDASGRVTAEAVFARLSVPHYHAAAMDGIAVRAADTHSAGETSPLLLQSGLTATWVDTGDPLPPDTDAVIMAEQVQELREGRLEIRAAVAPWQHVRPMGEDIVASELVLPGNQRLDAVALGALTAAGHSSVLVRARPRVAVLPTGSELIPAGIDPAPGQIVDFNSVVLANQVRDWGGEPTVWPPTPDDRALLRDRVTEALATHDVVVVNAGSSAGSEDYTAAVVAEIGTLLVHGVAIRPGHPLILGVTPGGKALIGLPGYPVSTILTSELFLRPLLYRLRGERPPRRARMQAKMTRKLLSPMGEDEFVRLRLGEVGNKVIATPLSRGAGVIMSMVRADAMLKIPRFSEGVHAGAEVEVELLGSAEDLKGTIVATGSHDLALDLIADELSRSNTGARLASSNVGSVGGLVALARGEAHLAGSHLLDETTGEYNVRYIKKYLPGTRVVLLNLAGRVQGLMVPRGNPLAISSVGDLLRTEVRFVNRQRGSGTRVLLDYHLHGAGFDPNQIEGYDREDYTHMAVAAAVAGGTADAGLGILAAARALALDFVPLFSESYQVVIPRVFYEAPVLAPFLAIVRGQSFRDRVSRLGGYDVSQMGTIAWES